MRSSPRRPWTTAFAAFLISGMVAAAAEAHGPILRSEVEPNGTAATANPLPLVGGYGVGVGAINPGGDLDFWTFSAPAGARVWILTDTGGTQAAGATSRDTIIDLLAANGTTVIENDDDDGTANGGDGTVESGLSSTIAGRTLATGGTYYIRVKAFSPTAIVDPYRLLVVVTNVTATPEVEPNDTAATANAIAGPSPIGLRSGSIAAAGDVDYYSVVAKAGDIIYFSADGDPERDGAGTDLVLELRSPADALLVTVDSSSTGSLTNPAAEAANFTVATAGTYYVTVRHFSATGTGTYHLMVAASPGIDMRGDIDADRRTDLGVYRSTTGEWIVSRSTDGSAFSVSWGAPSLGDIPVPADYDGDGQVDAAVYRATTGEWFIRFSRGGSTSVVWGQPSFNDIPVPGDYDGDGVADIAIYRKTTGQWFIRGGAVVTWGAPSLGDIPVPADYDGDGKLDIAVYRGSTGDWFLRLSAGGSSSVTWGAPSLGDIPVPADYDGDGRADVAVYRGGTGDWFLRFSGGGGSVFTWGAPSLSDVPVPGDYDGDGKADAAVYRTTSGQWFAHTASGPISRSWGAPGLGDTPFSLPAWMR